jgi:hypothetical protein
MGEASYVRRAWFGMDETVGRRTYSAPPQPFLGTSASGVEGSETTEREIDVAVRDINTKAFEQATAHGAPTSTKAAACYMAARR